MSSSVDRKKTSDGCSVNCYHHCTGNKNRKTKFFSSILHFVDFLLIACFFAWFSNVHALAPVFSSSQTVLCVCVCASDNYISFVRLIINFFCCWCIHHPCHHHHYHHHFHSHCCQLFIVFACFWHLFFCRAKSWSSCLIWRFVFVDLFCAKFFLSE